MWNRKKKKHHIAVVNNLTNYIIISLTFDQKSELFTLDNYQVIDACHGEYGSHFFINHTLFFNNIMHNARTYKNSRPTVALLFKEPFITQQMNAHIPSLTHENYIITHPLLLQCSILPQRHEVRVSAITEIDIAHSVAIHYTKHLEDEYSFSRLFIKKNSHDHTPPEHCYYAIAACGSYLMEPA